MTTFNQPKTNVDEGFLEIINHYIQDRDFVEPSVSSFNEFVQLNSLDKRTYTSSINNNHAEIIAYYVNNTLTKVTMLINARVYATVYTWNAGFASFVNKIQNQLKIAL